MIFTLYKPPFQTATPSAMHCNTLQCTATRRNFISVFYKICFPVRNAVAAEMIWYNSLATHTATRCNALQSIAMHCSTLQRTATRCITLQHTDSVSTQLGSCSRQVPLHWKNLKSQHSSRRVVEI